jgi:hypothetical protein
MITIIKFYLLMLTGVVSSAGDMDGVPLYNIVEEDGAIENAYKEEVLQYIETGTFLYNDFLVYEE